MITIPTQDTLKVHDLLIRIKQVQDRDAAWTVLSSDDIRSFDIASYRWQPVHYQVWVETSAIADRKNTGWVCVLDTGVSSNLKNLGLGASSISGDDTDIGYHGASLALFSPYFTVSQETVLTAGLNDKEQIMNMRSGRKV